MLIDLNRTERPKVTQHLGMRMAIAVARIGTENADYRCRKRGKTFMPVSPGTMVGDLKHAGSLGPFGT